MLSEFEDSLIIKEALESPDMKQVTIIGAGFIGVEMAEAFTTRGLQVRLIQLENQILPQFDSDITKPLELHLEQKGVELLLEESVLSLEGITKVNAVTTDKGTYETDLVLVSVGVKPNTSFLQGTTIQLSKEGAVLTNKYMQTNDPAIYAAGDCSTILFQPTNTQQYIPMGHNANKQGRLIAEHINQTQREFNGVLGTTVIKVIDMEAAKTGLTEKAAKELGLDFDSVMITGRNHAGYYPHPEKITVKIIFLRESKRVIGAELVGGKDTAMRINPFVIAIQSKLTVYDLQFADFAYAPPFAGVWDVIAVAANKVK